MSKSKFNWGTGILISIIIFMVATIATVVFLMNQKVDLVANDYYNRGIEHQKQIDKVNRTNALSDNFQIRLEDGFVKIDFPSDSLAGKYSGSIKFYRASDSDKDFSIPLSLNESGQQVIPTKDILKGYWKVIVEWNQNSIDYYKETSFVIN